MNPDDYDPVQETIDQLINENDTLKFLYENELNKNDSYQVEINKLLERIKALNEKLIQFNYCHNSSTTPIDILEARIDNSLLYIESLQEEINYWMNSVNDFA